MLAFLPRYEPYSFGLVAYQIGFCCITLNKSESDQNDRHRAARCRCTPSLPGYLLARQMTLTATRWICTELSRQFSMRATLPLSITLCQFFYWAC